VLSQTGARLLFIRFHRQYYIRLPSAAELCIVFVSVVAASLEMKQSRKNNDFALNFAIVSRLIIHWRFFAAG